MVSPLFLSWVVLMSMSATAVVVGMRFRRGVRIPAYLAIYRNTSLPAAIRYMPLFLPFFAAAIFIALIGVGVRIIAQGDRVLAVDNLSVAAFAGCFAIVSFDLAAVIVASLRPPARLLPLWLLDEDRRVGYLPPPVRPVDKILAIAAVGFSIGGIWLVGTAIRALLT